MLTAVCIAPATPLLAPELGGAAASELAVLRAHAVAAASELARRCERWTVVGVQGTAETPAAVSLYGGAVGTFAGFGVDLRVSLVGAPTDAATEADAVTDADADADADAVTDATMPLPLLIAGWLREQAGFAGPIAAELIAADARTPDAVAAGSALASRLAGSSAREGVLVVADGPTTLTAKAPGSYDPRAEQLDAAVRAAFADGAPSALALLDAELCAQLGAQGRAPWQLLAGLLGDAPVTAAGMFADAPYGVGYYTGLWSL